jgi:hypothetical protein
MLKSYGRKVCWYDCWAGKKETGVTWGAWNRGESLTSWTVLRSAHTDIPETANLCLSQEYSDQKLSVTVSMDTPLPDDDWPLASPVEDCTFAQEYNATPCFAGGEVPQA